MDWFVKAFLKASLSWLGAGGTSAAIWVRGVATANATSRFSVGVALVSGCGDC